MAFLVFLHLGEVPLLSHQNWKTDAGVLYLSHIWWQSWSSYSLDGKYSQKSLGFHHVLRSEPPLASLQLSFPGKYPSCVPPHLSPITPSAISSAKSLKPVGTSRLPWGQAQFTPTLYFNHAHLFTSPLDYPFLKLCGLSSHVCILLSTSSTVPGMWLMQ